MPNERNVHQKGFSPKYLKERLGMPYRNFVHITLMKVTAIDPTANTVSVSALGGIRSGASGGTYEDVQCVGFSLGTDYGNVDLTAPDNSKLADPKDPQGGSVRDSYAVVGFVEGHVQIPLCLAFINGPKSQMYFNEENFSMYRHGSDLYRFIDKDANLEMVHPSGFYIRIGQGLQKTDISTKQATKDENEDVLPWKTKTAPNPSMTISHPSGFSFIFDSTTGQEKVILTSKSGHMIVLDDTSGAEVLSIVHKLGSVVQLDKDGGIKLISKDGSTIQMNATDGSIVVTSKDGNVLSLSSDGVTLADKEGTELINLTSGKAEMVAAQEATIMAPKATFNSGFTAIGALAAFSAVIGENLESQYANHTHMVPQAPAGTLPSLPPTIPPYAFTGTPLDMLALFIKVKGNI